MEENNFCLDFSKYQLDSDESYEPRRQIFHSLMRFKIREILLVSSQYDEFIIEEEGLISELVIGEYRHLLLSQPPRVTRVYSGDVALLKIKKNQYDLVITTSKNIGMNPFDFGKKINEICPGLPVVLLTTDMSDLNLVLERENRDGIDKTFFWTGDSTLFLAIIKCIEDSINTQFDTRIGNVQVIILIEDSIRYYSMFLPLIYTEIVRQTQRSLSEDLNNLQRLLRRRARPKILLAETYEEGIEFYKQYKDYLLGIITDFHFPKKGKLDPNAGYKIAKQIKKELPHLPILMQSSELGNRTISDELDSYFLNKNSPTLVEDFQHFLLNHLGFGDFTFLLPKKKKIQSIKPKDIHKHTKIIGHASNMKEFVKYLQEVPLESIQFHADRNDFSNWLMARGEFKTAMELRPKKASDFTNLDEIRKHLITVFNESRREKQLGVITDFSKQKFEFDNSFTRLRGDSLGGKGRGIAFMRKLLTRYNLESKYKNVKITVPSTIVIGTLEFDRFIQENNLLQFIEKKDATDSEIAKKFLKSHINDELKKQLAIILKHFKSTLAVRSSSLLEDSLSHPFAGIFSTYMLPNNNNDETIRLKQLCEAIKLVYASVFYQEPRVYIESTSAKIEEEKMAVIIQELVGNYYQSYYYPTFSGVAQSYNFYPVSHQKYEDGIVNLAIGLGKTVVGGGKVLRFSPRHPSILPDFSTPEDILKNSQKELYVLDTSNKDFHLSEDDDSTLKKINVEDIKGDHALEYATSTYDKNDGMIRDSWSDDGPHLVTFAGILKYDLLPIASIIQEILDIGQKGMGCPIEIEFAVKLNKDNNIPHTFSILQLRPLVPSHEHCEIIWDANINRENVFIHSETALGNGIIKSVKDIIYVPPDRFDNTKTIQISDEIGKINNKLASESLHYLLIGPGRWGSQDRFLGIPVRWNQISNVKVMVETALEKFNIKPSQGTHFFHNITSRGIGYINVPYKSKDYFIDWKWLEKQKIYDEHKFVKHIQLSNPLIIKIDGRCSHAIIMKPEDT